MRKTLTIGLLAITFSVNVRDYSGMAGRDCRIESDLLRVISFREPSWRNSTFNVISQSEYAVGRVQMHSQNSSHLVQFGIAPRQLYTDSCLDTYTGAYYPVIVFKHWGYSWRAIGAYSAGFRETEVQERKRRQHAKEIQAIYTAIKKNAPPR